MHIQPVPNTIDAKKITLSAHEIDNNEGGRGLEIHLPDYQGNPQTPDDGQIFIEYYEGKIRVHVWNGEPNPVTTELERKI